MICNMQTVGVFVCLMLSVVRVYVMVHSEHLFAYWLRNVKGIFEYIFYGEASCIKFHEKKFSKAVLVYRHSLFSFSIIWQPHCDHQHHDNDVINIIMTSSSSSCSDYIAVHCSITWTATRATSIQDDVSKGSEKKY